MKLGNRIQGIALQAWSMTFDALLFAVVSFFLLGFGLGGLFGMAQYRDGFGVIVGALTGYTALGIWAVVVYRLHSIIQWITCPTCRGSQVRIIRGTELPTLRCSYCHAPMNFGESSGGELQKCIYLDLPEIRKKAADKIRIKLPSITKRLLLSLLLVVLMAKLVYALALIVPLYLIATIVILDTAFKLIHYIISWSRFRAGRFEVKCPVCKVLITVDSKLERHEYESCRFCSAALRFSSAKVSYIDEGSLK